MRIKRIILPAAGVLVIATAAYLVAQGGYERRASTTTTTTVAAVASPYDLTEPPADGVTSYMVAAGREPFMALLVAREGKVWRPEGDLAALVRAITEQAAAQ